MTERANYHWHDDPGDSSEFLDKDDNFNPEMEGNIYNFPIIPDDWEVPSSLPIAREDEDCSDVEDEGDIEAILANRLEGYVGEYERFKRLAFSTEEFVHSQEMKPGETYTLKFHSFNNPLRESQYFDVRFDLPMILHGLANMRKDQIIEGWGAVGDNIVSGIDEVIQNQRRN